VLQLKCTPNSNLKYFDCSWFSEYPLEGEHIVCGGLGTATICNIYDLCAGMRYDDNVMAMKSFKAAISKKAIPKLDEESMYRVASVLSEMMTHQYKRNHGKNGSKEEESKSDDASFINTSFAAMCSAICYAELSLEDINGSERMKGALLDEEGMIRFYVLSRVLPNCSRYFVDGGKMDAMQTEKTLFDGKLTKFLTKVSDGSSIVESITFAVNGKIKVNVSKFNNPRWTAECVPIGTLQFVTIRKNGGGK